MISRRLLVFPLVFAAGVAGAAMASATNLDVGWRLGLCAAVEIPAVGIGLWYLLGSNTGMDPTILLREAIRASMRVVTPLAVLVVVVVSLATGWHTITAIALAGAVTVDLFLLQGFESLLRWTRSYELRSVQQFSMMQERAEAMQAQAREDYIAETSRKKAFLAYALPQRFLQSILYRWRLLMYSRRALRARRDADAAENLQAAQEQVHQEIA
ncbi:MAG TPA: hypothetical protein VE972_08360 [Conexibacter sp.]|nr:hypothetical protein [Conexibacter sp.]